MSRSGADVYISGMFPDDLPGAELVRDGLAHLTSGRESTESLLVSIGAPRLRLLGVSVPDAIAQPEERLFDRLTAEYGDAAHGRYNALVRRLVSFERALACARRESPNVHSIVG